MRKVSLVLAALLIIQSPLVVAQSMPGGMGGGGMGGGGMGGGMGGPGEGGPGGPGGGGKPRAPKPVKRKDFDKIVTAMFEEADANRDGTVTLDELHTVIEARRDALIRARFTSVDTDRNGAISEAEFIAWQKQMGSAASNEQAAMGANSAIIADAIMPEVKDDDARALADLIAPLSGTVIAAANTNYDAGLSLDELLAYEGKRFEEADKNGDGYLTMDELRPRDGKGGPGGPGNGPRGAGNGAGGPPPCPPGQSCGS